MKKILLIISVFATSILFAQTKHSVTVQSNTFTPNNLTINAGDTVEWTNVGGNHNVNGTTASFPGNPESFGNSVGAGWTYTFVFGTVGTYTYKCDPHASLGMVGAVTVQATTGVKETSSLNKMAFYPNPTTTELNFSNYEKGTSVAIYSLSGKVVLSSKLLSKKLDVSILIPGIYFVKTILGKEETTEKLIIQ